MKAEITEVAPCRKRIAIEVPPDKVNTTFDEVYRSVQEMAQVRGFRKGHAPRKMLERKFGKDVTKDVRAKLVEESLRDCMKENSLSPLGEPDLDLEKLEVQPDRPFGFTTEVDVRPQFDLPPYKGLKLVEKAVPVADADLDVEVDRLRQTFAEQIPVEGAAEKGDVLTAEVLATVGEKEITNEKAATLRTDMTSLFGVDLPNLPEQLVGLKAGDEKALSVAFPADDPREDVKGQAAAVTLKVGRVTRPRLPAADDALAGKLGCKDLADLKGRIRTRLESERRQAAREALEKEAIAQLVAAVQFELPAEFLKRLTELNAKRARLRLEYMGANEKLLEEKSEELQRIAGETTERQLRWTLLSDAIADKEAIEIKENDVQVHIEMLARAQQMAPAQLLKRIQDQNGLAALVSEIRDIRVMQLIFAAATITQEPAAAPPAANG